MAEPKQPAKLSLFNVDKRVRDLEAKPAPPDVSARVEGLARVLVSTADSDAPGLVDRVESLERINALRWWADKAIVAAVIGLVIKAGWAWLAGWF